MYIFKTKTGFAGIDSVRKDLNPLVSYCIEKSDINFENKLKYILETKKREPKDFFVYGVYKDKDYVIEEFLDLNKNLYEFIIETDKSSFFYNKYCYDYLDISDEELADNVFNEINYEFFNYYLNSPEIYCRLYDEDLNLIKEIDGFYGKTIEDSKILDEIKDISFFIGYENELILSDFQRDYFNDEFRFFKKDLSKILDIEEFDDIIKISDNDSFLEFIERDSFINGFENILKNLEPSSRKDDLSKIFTKNNPRKDFNLERLKKAEILDLFFR